MRQRSQSEDRSTGYWALETALAILLLFVIWGWKYVAKSSLWVGLSPFERRLSEGICLEGLGMIFLWVRARTKTLAPRSIWDFRLLMYDLAFVAGGVVCLVEAFRIR